MRGEEAYKPPGGSPAIAHPLVQVSFRCSTTGVWTSPGRGSGSGLAGGNRTLTVITCPATTAITSIQLSGDSTYIGVVSIVCGAAAAPPSGTDDCPAVNGFYSLPGYTAAGATNVGSVNTGANAELAFQDCVTSGSCNAVAWGFSGGSAFGQGLSADLAALQGVLPGDGGGYCDGTFAEAPPLPPQYYCARGSVLTSGSSGLPVATASSVAECAYECSSFGCTGFVFDFAEATPCNLFSSVFTVADTFTVSASCA